MLCYSDALLDAYHTPRRKELDKKASDIMPTDPPPSPGSPNPFATEAAQARRAELEADMVAKPARNISTKSLFDLYMASGQVNEDAITGLRGSQVKMEQQIRELQLESAGFRSEARKNHADTLELLKGIAGAASTPKGAGATEVAELKDSGAGVWSTGSATTRKPPNTSASPAPITSSSEGVTPPKGLLAILRSKPSGGTAKTFKLAADYKALWNDKFSDEMRGEVDSGAYSMLCRAGDVGELKKARDKLNHPNADAAGGALQLLEALQSNDEQLGQYDERKLPETLTAGSSGLGEDNRELWRALLTLDRRAFPRGFSELIKALGIDEQRPVDQQLGDLADLIAVPFAVMRAEHVAPFVSALHRLSREVRFFAKMDDGYAEVVKAKNRVVDKISKWVDEAMVSFRSNVARGATLPGGDFIPGVKSETFKETTEYIAREKSELTVQMEAYQGVAPPSTSTAATVGATQATVTPQATLAAATATAAMPGKVMLNKVEINRIGLPVLYQLKRGVDAYFFSGDKLHPRRDLTKGGFFAGQRTFSEFIDVKTHTAFRSNPTPTQVEWRTQALKIILGNAKYTHAHPKVGSILGYAKERYQTCLSGRFPDK